MKKLRNFLPSQRCRVPLSIHRKKIVLRRRAFWDFENFSTFFQLPSVHSLWLCEPSRSLVVSSFRHPGFTLSTLSEETHKSLLAHQHPIDKIPSTGLWLSFTPSNKDEAKATQNRTFIRKINFPTVFPFQLMRSLSDGERASQTVRAGEKT